MDMGAMNGTRKIINKIDQGRKDLKETDGKTKDRVEGWRKNIHAFTNDIKAQATLLDRLNDGEDNQEGGSDIKRDYFTMMVARLHKDIEELVRICEKLMSLNINKSISSKESNEQNWTLMRQQIRNEAMKVLVQSQDSSKDRFQLLSQMMNMRDHLHKQISFASLYRKQIIWIDLNIPPEEYCHQKVVECINKINDFQEKLGYKPTRLLFEEVTLEQSGYFSFEGGGNECESTVTLEAMIQNQVDMENLIKKNFMMKSEKLSQFQESNPIQMTLREEVESINQELKETSEALKKSNFKLYSQNKDNDSKNQADQQDTINKLETKVALQQMELQDKLKILKNFESQFVQQKTNLKQAEEKILKFENWHQPRIKETQKYQKEVSEALEKIKQDANLLPDMFRAEAKYRKENKKEKDLAVSERNDMFKQHHKLVSERDDLKSELERKKRLAQQAMAARGEIKHFLDQAKGTVALRESEIVDLNLQMENGRKEVERFKAKHDEMFASVSGLNNRIEELEQHKLHLLERLKKLGDRGDLSYIVKTQKLDQIQVKEMKDRVSKDEYNPESGRKERDDEYERVQREKDDENQNIIEDL